MSIHFLPVALIVLAAQAPSTISNGVAAQAADVRYLSLLQAYQHGNSDAAVRELASWNTKRIESGAVPRGAALQMQATPTLRAIAMLHTEAILRGAPVEAHLRRAREAIGLLRQRRPGSDPFASRFDSSGASFDRGWQIVISSCLLSLGLLQEAQKIPSSDDPEIALLLGSISEAVATDTVLSAAARANFGVPSGFDISMRPAISRLLEAESRFRSALKSVPGLTEARVRLGRVLDEKGDREAARAQLERGYKEAGDGYLAYMAALLLGRSSEREKRFIDARAWYETAIRLYPEAQTPYLALAYLLEQDGQRGKARDTIRAMLEPRPDRRDPWWVYNYAQFWQIDARVQGLRAMVQQ